MNPPEWTTAMPDWERRIIAGESLIHPPLFPHEARDALQVFDELRMVDAIGSPRMGDVCRPWMRDFAASVFGSYDSGYDENMVDTGSPTAGRRLIREFFLLISKKNGKSTVAAAVMLTALLRNWRKSGEFLILAPTHEIAKNSFDPARDMVNADEELRELILVQEHIKTLTHRVTGATLKVVAAENETVGGKKAIGVFLDETWQFGKKANAENMLREAFGGMMSRPEGFIITASTMADAAPAGVFRQRLQYARKVRDGEIIDNKFMPVIFEFPKAMIDSKEYRNPKNFYITNPNLGASVDEEHLVNEFEKAEQESENSLIGFASKHLNLEIGLALRSDRWAGADFWEAQGREGITLDAILTRCDVVDVGIDGGGLDDLLGLVVIGRDRITREWLLWGRAWAHPSVLERRKSEAARFKDFAKDGDLVLVETIGNDVVEVAQIVAEIEASGLLDKVGCDPAGIGSVLDALIAEDVPQEKIVGVSQGWRLGGSIKTLERKLAEGALIHSGSPMMAWVVGNAKVEPRGNSILITKQASGFAKIDPLMAAFNAVSLMSLNPDGGGKSFWDTK